MITFSRAPAWWIKTGLLAMLLTGARAAEDAVVTGMPATLPLADGARIVIQGLNYYSSMGNKPVAASLTSGFVHPLVSKISPFSGPTPHLLAQDAMPTAANVFTVTVIPKPATFPAAQFFGPDCQFFVLRDANGKYVCMLDDDTLGAASQSIGPAQILVVDRGEPFRIFCAPVAYEQRHLLPTFRWPRVAGMQLLFIKSDSVIAWVTNPRPPTDSPAGAVRILLVDSSPAGK